MRDLITLRDELDRIDQKIVKLYEERMDVCQEVGTIKIEMNKQVFDKEREDEKIKKVLEQTKNLDYKVGVAELYSQLLTQSRKLQYQIMVKEGITYNHKFHMVENFARAEKKVVFQGSAGAYSEAATKKFFGNQVEKYHVRSFKEAVLEVVSKKAVYGVLPIENSSAGAVFDVYDLLSEVDVTIIGEIIMPINHVLAAGKGANLNTIKEVYSHSQALMQCSDYLDTHKDWEQIKVANTAIAAEKIKKDQNIQQAAICSKEAAKLNELVVLEEQINKSEDNKTRFVIIAGEKIYQKESDKISICFELPHESGSLYRLLSHIIFNGLNMTKIESRPVKNKNWEYKFFVDFSGNLGDAAVENALIGLAQESINFKILGNYQVKL